MIKKIVGNIDPTDKKVYIWGAGFAGLIAGYFLKKNGFDIRIYEKSKRVGGKIRTKKNSFGFSETGANALYLNQDSFELIKELGLEPISASKKLKKLVLINGKPKRAIQLKVILKTLAYSYSRPPLISDGLTVADFFRPLLGEEIIQQFLSPALGGIYSTPSEKLHFKSIFDIPQDQAQFSSYWEFFKKLLNSRKNSKKLEMKGSISFEGGMQVLIDRLYHELKDSISLSHKHKFDPSKNNIICTDAHNAAEILEDHFPQISHDLKRINYQTLSSTTVYLKREIKSLSNAFGVLIPAGTKLNSIGIVNNKAVFPINNSNVYSYNLIAKKRMEEKDIISDLKMLQAEFVPEDIEHFEMNFWEQGIPVYDLQRFLSMKKIDEILSTQTRLAIFGNYVNGISLREMITLAKNFTSQFSHSS